MGNAIQRYFNTKLLSDFEAYRFVFMSTEKYELVGRLLKPGESPANYSEEEEDNVKSKEEWPPRYYEHFLKFDQISFSLLKSVRFV